MSWLFGFEYYFDIPCVYAPNQRAAFLTYITSTPQVWAGMPLMAGPVNLPSFRIKAGC
jgi:hypothetical protein